MSNKTGADIKSETAATTTTSSSTSTANPTPTPTTNTNTTTNSNSLESLPAASGVDQAVSATW